MTITIGCPHCGDRLDGEFDTELLARLNEPEVRNCAMCPSCQWLFVLLPAGDGVDARKPTTEELQHFMTVVLEEHLQRMLTDAFTGGSHAN